MRLVPNWREILRKSWAIRISVFTFTLVALADLWPALGGVISPQWFFFVGVPLTVLARILDQGLSHGH